MSIWKFLLDVLELFSMSEHEKDIQILLLQQQLRIAERQQKRAPSLTRWEKIGKMGTTEQKMYIS
ncbi:MAG: hypothetical protein WBC91_09115 [Phototrophicaceae bacterium]